MSKKNGTFEENMTRLEQIVRSMEYASILGVKHIVVHPVPVPMGIDTVAHNVKYYKTLEPYAKQFGIKICVAVGHIPGQKDGIRLLQGDGFGQPSDGH